MMIMLQKREELTIPNPRRTFQLKIFNKICNTIGKEPMNLHNEWFFQIYILHLCILHMAMDSWAQTKIQEMHGSSCFL